MKTNDFELLKTAYFGDVTNPSDSEIFGFLYHIFKQYEFTMRDLIYFLNFYCECVEDDLPFRFGTYDFEKMRELIPVQFLKEFLDC